ncbi:MAG: type II secretion system F family protein [Patescibacteria group bacterium]
MTLYKYSAIDRDGNERAGEIEAHNQDIAINSLQERGFIISSIKEASAKGLLEMNITLGGVKNKDIVILSKQLSTLFEAQVSALRVFRLLSAESESQILRETLEEIAADISDGSSITNALKKHPQVFSNFYVNMVAAGEQSGKLSQTFTYLSDYLDRSYELTSKAKNALIYPAFIVSVFVIVMYLMMTMVIPKISKILTDAGQELPFFTKVTIGVSNFLVDYGIFLIIAFIIGGFFLYRYSQTEAGSTIFDDAKLRIPYVGTLYERLYLARISGNISMMLASGISMVKTLENTASVVDNKIYENILLDVTDQVTNGKSVSEAFATYPQIPGIFTQMVKVGEETGRISNVLDTMAKFYEREVVNAVDSLVGLIEPIMIVLLGVGVGGLLASVLIPIYNITGTV